MGNPLEAFEYALADEDTRDAVIATLAAAPAELRERLFWVLQVAMATPLSEQIRLLDDLRPLMLPDVAAGI